MVCRPVSWPAVEGRACHLLISATRYMAQLNLSYMYKPRLKTKGIPIWVLTLDMWHVASYLL